MALPLYAMAGVVGVGAELIVFALVGFGCVAGIGIARLIPIDAFQFALVGAICGFEALLIGYAMVR